MGIPLIRAAEHDLQINGLSPQDPALRRPNGHPILLEDVHKLANQNRKIK